MTVKVHPHILFYLVDVLTYTSGHYGAPSNQSEAYFNGSSYIILNTKLFLKKPTGLSFRTCYGGSLFSQRQNNDLIELSVSSGGILFRTITAGKSYDYEIPGNFINNQWHTVYFLYRLGNLTIDVDGQTEMLANSSFHNDLLSSPDLYNDGAAVTLVGKQFNGCLLEGPSIIFNSDHSSGHNVLFGPCPIPYDTCTPRERIISYDYCMTEPCMRHGTCHNGQTSYTCTCLPRYSGKNCEIDLGDPCDRAPPLCKNSAACKSDGLGDFTCTCAPGFAGLRCEQELSTHPKCSKNPCLNGGMCDYDLESERVECHCRAGFSGPNCEVNVDECSPNPCLNGGVCTDGFNNFTCDCGGTGYVGVVCEIDVNECKVNPCFNQGTCFNTYGSYICQCLPGYQGNNCQEDVNACLSNPCFNNGVCLSLSGGGYECRCLGDFLGDHCEIEQSQQRQCDPSSCPPYADCIDAGAALACICKPEYPGEYPNCNVDSICANNPCMNGGKCTPHKGYYNCTCLPGFTGPACDRCISHRCRSKCIENCIRNDKRYNCRALSGCASKLCIHALACQDYLGGYYCACRQGWTGLNCDIELGPCSSDPCLNSGSCVDRSGFFSCVCSPGFKGKKCQINIDECAPNPCQNGATCKDLINDFLCDCPEQWMGKYCEKPYDACELYPCQNNATCITAPNKHDYACECRLGFEGDHCEVNIDDCAGTTCPPGQVCVDLVNAYDCQCPPGFAGQDCSMDVDPCAKEPCNNGTCKVDAVSYKFTCECRLGFTGPLCNQDQDECADTTHKVCNNGICVNTEGSYQCYCMPGFTGERCELDFDECLSMPCRNNATCDNLINNYKCNCPPGYAGKDCTENIDDCDPNPCSVGATCVDGINAFTCTCQPGMTGKLCDINIDDCESSPCLNGAQCIDGLNKYTCDCSDTGYEGVHCENNIDDCIGSPCKNGANCIDKVNDYDCNCYRGYTGKNCEIDINECESNPCQFNGTCLERSNVTLYNESVTSLFDMELPASFNRPFNYSDAFGYECLCVPGVTGQYCETNINECDSNPCQYGQCSDRVGYYVCECDEGYEGELCDRDIDECKKYNPCVHGECSDRVANYYCHCHPGYGGKNCSVQLTGCGDKPCKNDGECRPYVINETEHKYNCTCPNGFHGNTCEMITTMSLSGSSLITVNTTRDEGYDIQFRFKTTLGDGLLALGRGLTYYFLGLSKGRLNLHSSLLNKWEGVFIGSNLNDSKWQKVFVAINSTHLVLSANDEQTIYPINSSENNVTFTSFPMTHIGGTPSSHRRIPYVQPALVGCVEDIIINGKWVLPQLRDSSWINLQRVDEGCLREEQCKPNPCYSGGHCTDLWRTFSCSCERPYLGQTCKHNYTAATFGYENITNSLVTVNVSDYAKRAVRQIVDISMFIRTRQSRGQIFYLGSGFITNHQISSLDDTCIAAQLENGELYVQTQFNGQAEGYTVGGEKLDNGYNHLIEVSRNGTLVQVKLNGTEYFRKTMGTNATLDAQVLYLGGLPQSRSVRQTNENMATLKMDSTSPTAPASATTVLSSVPFKGLIQDVQISNGSTTMIVEFFPLQASDVKMPPPFGNVSFDPATVLAGVHSDDSCKINPCQHEGVCQNAWNDYNCVCTRGFKGKDCNEVEFCEFEGCPGGSVCRNLEDGYECIANSTFNGLQDPLRYQFKFVGEGETVLEFDSLEVTYRTRSWGTAFFGKLGEDYFVVFIYHNEVVVEWSFNGVMVTRRFRKDQFKGQWITLLFTFKDQTFRGGFKENVVDDLPNFEVKDFDSQAIEEIFKHGEIYVAGSDNKTFDYWTVIENTDYNNTGYIPTGDATTDSINSNSLESAAEYFSEEVLLYKVDQGKKTDYFKGCLGEIRIGGLLLPYFPNKNYTNQTYIKKFFELEDTTRTELGCVLCYDTDCFNQGYCINRTETYKCQCVPGYAADDCSVDINECEDNECRNNATCIDSIAKYECDCMPGYEGPLCEIDIDECLSNPCRHGGTCKDLVGTFKCDCPEDFVGKQCEAPLLITCENKPCREGATCETGPNPQTGNNFTCYCTEGMVGPLCDTPFCESKPCEHGLCNTSAEVPFCQCDRGFQGKFCEENIDDCVSPTGGSPCQNGGVCKDDIYRYDCNCSGTGYFGLLCESDIDECTTIRMACGSAGTCENMPGSYRCICDTIKGKCGQQCDLDDPCEVHNPCVHGTCLSQCTDIPDYICTCEDEYTGKNCTETKVAAVNGDGSLNILYIVVPILLIILISAAIGMAVLVNVARSKRATRGTYSPSAQEFCNPRVELDHVLKPPPEERLI